MASIKNNYIFQLAGDLPTTGSSVSISVDLERGNTVVFDNGYVVLRSGNKIERIKATASGGTMIISKRGLDETDTDVEVAGLKKDWKEGTTCYITILAVQVQSAINVVSSGAIKFPQYSSDATRDTAIPSPTAGMQITRTDLNIDQKYQGGTWVNVSGGAIVADASETVAGKGQVGSDAQFTAGTLMGSTGATLWATLVQLKKSISLRNSVSSLSDSDEFGVNVGGEDKKIMVSNVINYTKVNSIIKTGAYFGPGSDGDVTISSNATLSRDMYYNNLTINSTFTLDTAGYKVYVKGTLTNNGTISRNGNNASGINAGAILGQGSLNAEVACTNGGAGGTGGGDGGSTTSGSSNPSYINTGSAKGGNGGNNYNSPTGGEGGTTSIGSTTRGTMYNKILTFEELFLNYINPASQTTSSTIIDPQYFGSTKYKGPAGSSGGGGGGSSTLGGAVGGNGGGAGGNGGVIWICAKIVNNVGVISSRGGNGSNGDNAPGGSLSGGGGGGGGGNGGVVYLIYSTLTNIGTVTLTGGTGGNGGTGGGSGAQNGLSGENGSTGTMIQIQIT